MEFNENSIKGKWLEIKGEVQKSGGKLTNDELERTKGDMKAIGGLIQQRYGEAQASSEKKLAEIVKRFEDTKDAGVKKAKDTLKH